MKIYSYIPDSDIYDSFLFKVEDREKRSILVSGETCSETWKPVNIEEYKVGKVGHFPSLYRSVPVFSKKAIDVFSKEFSLNMEVLPIVDQPDFFIVNILEVIDALNHQVKTFEVPGGVYSAKLCRFQPLHCSPKNIQQGGTYRSTLSGQSNSCARHRLFCGLIFIIFIFVWL